LIRPRNNQEKAMARVFLRDVYRFDDEIDDGRTVRVPMLVMDGHRPGYAQLTDQQVADRERARSDWIKQTTDAWRSPQRDVVDARKRRPPDDDVDDDDEDTDDCSAGRNARDARTAAQDARDAYVRRLCDAWRTPSCDAAGPDAGTQLLHRHLRGTEEDDNAAAAREKSYAAYKARLERAWRNPAPAAEGNETRLEAWRKPGARPGLHQDAIKDSAAAYAAYVERIGRAWRGT
jgi:hypothetical protein